MTSSSRGNSQQSKSTKTEDPSTQIVDVSSETVPSKKVSNKARSKKSISSIGGGPTRKNSISNNSSIPEIINGIALGMIETRGMVPAIEAADAMTKAAEVKLISREFVGGGYVSVLVRGETGAVNASVRAGADACERVGDGLVAAHIIARPHSEVEPVLRQSRGKRRL